MTGTFALLAFLASCSSAYWYRKAKAQEQELQIARQIFQSQRLQWDARESRLESQIQEAEFVILTGRAALAKFRGSADAYDCLSY